MRYADGQALAASGHRARRTGAVYLWGYTVEMLLKAAFFDAIGYDDGSEIARPDLQAATQLAPTVGLVWVGGLHAIHNWGRLLIRFRAVVPGLAYPDAAFAGEVEVRSFRVHQRWRESLRYHANVAYSHELARMREQTEWFLQRSREL